MQTLFFLSNLVVLPFWALMIFLPRWRWTLRLAGSLWIVAPLALAYTILIAPRLPGLAGDLANPDLARIAALLGTPTGAVIGWIHFLAFDLFVGRWVYLDSRDRNISAWLVSPALFLILMVGPLGYLAYLAVRLAWAQFHPERAVAAQDLGAIGK